MRGPTATALAPLSPKASICGGPPSLGAIESPPAIASCPPEFIVRMAVLKADDNLLFAHLDQCSHCSGIYDLALTRLPKKIAVDIKIE
jgi:hypothetical protein